MRHCTCIHTVTSLTPNYSSNILLDGCMRAKVADFGISKPMPPLPTDKSYIKVLSFRGTRGYAADEYLDGELSTKLDVFSFGVVFHDMYIVRHSILDIIHVHCIGGDGNIQWEEGL